MVRDDRGDYRLRLFANVLCFDSVPTLLRQVQNILSQFFFRIIFRKYFYLMSFWTYEKLKAIICWINDNQVVHRIFKLSIYSIMITATTSNLCTLMISCMIIILLISSVERLRVYGLYGKRFRWNQQNLIILSKSTWFHWFLGISTQEVLNILSLCILLITK